MATANLTIRVSGLQRQTLTALESHARAEGLSVEAYVKELIEADMSISNLARTKSIDEIFAPVQDQFRNSGMSEDELDQLIDTARGEYRKEIARKKKR